MVKSPFEDEIPPSWLVVAATRDGVLVYEAGWRHRDADGDLRTMKRRLGRAWLERDGADGYRRRRGRPKPGYLDEHAAIVAKDRLVREVESRLGERAAAIERDANRPATFREVAYEYLHWLEHVRDAKPSTLLDHRYLLVEPGTPHRRGTGTHGGQIMKALGDRPAAEITTREINKLLVTVASRGIAARTINRHRQLIGAVFSYGCREATFALPRNPGLAADRRLEPEPDLLDFYSPEEVEALARAWPPGCTVIPMHRRSATRRPGHARQRIARTPRSSVLRRTQACAAASSSRCAGATSTSVCASSSSAARSARTSSRRRRSHVARARCRCPTRPREHSIACPSAATSRGRTTSSSSIVSADGWTARRYAGEWIAHASARDCVRCASMICATRMGRCSSPAGSTWRP